MQSLLSQRINLDRNAEPLTGGNWVTIRGASVYIRDGVAIAGPPHLVGKNPGEIGDHGKAPTVARPGFTPIERDAAGKYLGDNPEHAARLKALKIEPGLTHVHLNNDPEADQQVVGKDSKGRTQRKYKAGHTENSTLATHVRVRDLRKQLPAIREKLANDATEEGAALRLIDHTGFRIGSDTDTGADVQAYGATTLNAAHIKTVGGKTSVQFVGKKGVDQDHEIEHPAVAKELSERVAKANGGNLFKTTDAKVRARWKELAGPKFKVKDLRTATGTETAITAVKGTSAPTTVAELAAAKMAVGEIVAKKLGNTPTIALKSYIDPLVFKDWESKVSNLEQAGLIKTAAAAKGLADDAAAMPWIKRHGASYRSDFKERLKSSLGKKTFKAADPANYQLRR